MSGITGEEVRDTARVVEVSGNNQMATPGQELPVPLVVKMEDEFGNPIAGVEVQAEIIQGEAEFVAPEADRVLSTRLAVLPSQTDDKTPATAITDAQGEARFFLQVISNQQDIVTQVTFLEQQIEFTTLVSANRECDPEPTDMPIAYGNVIVNCTIDSPIESHTFRFVGSIGDQVLVRMRPLTGNIEASLRIFRQDGTLLCSGGRGGGDSRTFELSTGCMLDDPASHTIFVGDTNADESGDYEFTLELLNR